MIRLSAGGKSLELSGALGGAGGLTKTGDGILVFSGPADNTYAGDTRVHSGTLVLNNDGHGFSAGELSTGGAATLSSGSAFNVELNGYQPAGYDRLIVNGKFSPGNADLNVSWGFVPAVGDAFTIIDNDDVDAVAGTFNGLAEGALLTAGNVRLQITYAGGSGNDVVLSATEVKPLEDLRITAIASDGIKTQLEWTGGIPFYRVGKRARLPRIPGKPSSRLRATLPQVCPRTAPMHFTG